MRDFLCPAKREVCPDSQDQIELWLAWRNWEFTREYSWPGIVPDPEAEGWYCKYRVLVKDSLLEEVTSDKIILDVVMDGFDDYAVIIL